MTDTTAARRQLLALLLDRVERGNILLAEAPLIRPLVLADQTIADTEWSHTERAEADVNFNADRAHEERQRADLAEGVVYRLRQAVGEAGAAALPRSELAGFVEQMTAILDTPSDGGPTPVRTYYRGNDEAEMHAEYMRLLTVVARVRELGSRMRAPSMGPIAHSWADEVDAILDGPSPMPDDAQPTARRGTHLCHDTDPTTLKECALDHQHTGDHADANVTWPRQPDDARRLTVDQAIDVLADDIAHRAVEGNGTGQILGILGVADNDPVIARCSPLVNPDCPGHVAPPYCERAASSPIAAPAPINWERLAEQQPAAFETAPRCTAQYHGEPGETWHCTLNAGHNGDHVSAEDGNNYWNDHVGVYPVADAPSEQQQ